MLTASRWDEIGFFVAGNVKFLGETLSRVGISINFHDAYSKIGIPKASLWISGMIAFPELLEFLCQRMIRRRQSLLSVQYRRFHTCRLPVKMNGIRRRHLDMPESRLWEKLMTYDSQRLGFNIEKSFG